MILPLSLPKEWNKKKKVIRKAAATDSRDISCVVRHRSTDNVHPAKAHCTVTVAREPPASSATGCKENITGRRAISRNTLSQ
ncbi:MAG: hypothetical protein GY757_55985 [bacterium]|nr:hypothetical protein [bacterium]